MPARDVETLGLVNWTPELWQSVLRVEVTGASGQPMAGRYSATDGIIRFTPMYGFDKGRTFVVYFDARKIPTVNDEEPWRQRILERTFTVAGAAATRSTEVRQVYPSGDTLPENMLRFYIEFSAPMGRGRAMQHIHLVDEMGKEVADPFLPVEADFWDPARTRFTLFFDPGRVKRGIKPNRDLGRALEAGKRYTLVITDQWMDASGQMLLRPHRHTFTAGRAVERALDTKAWKVAPPRAGTRDPLIVTFPWALDYGLLQRALTVRSSATGSHVVGEVAVAGHETQWLFTPRDAWTTGDYSLQVMTLLEDPEGNRIGRAFEVMRPVNEPERVEIGFSVR